MFPDKVEIFLLPEIKRPVYYRFAVTLDGLKFGEYHTPHPAPESGEDQASPVAAKDGNVTAFEAKVERKEREWLVYLQIPWETIGGKPQGCFGLLPLRTRWRNGEVSSPVAINFGERPPTDLFIEIHFSKNSALIKTSGSLCQLPSGALRWQRPARLTYPGPETLREIWRLQQSLGQATEPSSLARRIDLTRRWLDLLTLEGFNFRATGGSIVPEDLLPKTIRHRVNITLQANEMDRACQLLDTYLHKLDSVSRRW